MIFPMDYKTMALLAIVTGLVIICMGLWYVWNTQQVLGTEVRYLRNQHISLQEQLKKQATTDALKPSSVQQIDADVKCTYASADASTQPTPASQHDGGEASADANDVLHRSFQMVNSATDASKHLSASANTHESSSSAEDDDTDETDGDGEYDDDDQHVETSDIVNPLHSTPESVEQQNNTNEDTNYLVESILSNIVSETVEKQVEKKCEQNDQNTILDITQTTDETIKEDFLENSGNYTALAESLRKKTVVELKKMCAEYQIGIKKGKTFLKKEELIEELVVKMPNA